MGSSLTAASVGRFGVVGRARTSTPSHVGMQAARRSAIRYSARYASAAVNAPAAETIAATVGSSPATPLVTASPTAAARSATTALPYNIAPSSSNGAMSTPTMVAPRAARRATHASHHARMSESRATAAGHGSGTPTTGGQRIGRTWAGARHSESAGSGPATTFATRCASSTRRANTDGQSNRRTAGTIPAVLTRPGVGLSPTIPFNAAGTRPDPAVSVPIETGTTPRATAMAEPELDPPGTRSGRSAFGGTPYGVRVPTSPVANWSRFVLPTSTAPAARSRATTVASASGVRAKPGHPAVVGTSAASMLSLTTNGTPNSGNEPVGTAASRAAWARAPSTSGSPMSTPGGSSATEVSTASITSTTDAPDAYASA